MHKRHPAGQEYITLPLLTSPLRDDIDAQRLIPLNRSGVKLGEFFWNEQPNIIVLLCWPVTCDVLMENIENNWSIVRPRMAVEDTVRGITTEASLEEMGVTQAILSRICWSHDRSSSMAYQGDIHRGTWAGDRIHIMCENRHDVVLMAESKDPSKAPWKDVTEACVQMLLDIRSAEVVPQSNGSIEIDWGSYW
ncbi:hypothetical protein BU17DRAFT_67829 [Hysterangium stoloniferum]|nr:hypothetical protein BU17DRAFT_67829 [Hysterangium stoloniferum]